MSWSLAKVKAMVAREGQGATLFAESESSWVLLLDSPPGKILRESGCHCSAMVYGNGFPVRPAVDWQKCAESIREILSHGFEDCPEGERCDVCNPDSEELERD